MFSMKLGSISARIACSIAVTVMAAGTAQAGMIVVPSSQPTIQAAINAAQSGDTIIVNDGTYAGAGNFNLNMMGKAITLRSANGPASCIINANASQQNQHSVFVFQNGETASTVIDGFTIKGGLAFNGAGVYLQDASPTFQNCRFQNNHANCWGAALYYQGDSSPILKDCVFVNNYSADDGGAIFGFGGGPTLSNCLIANNVAESLGGAIAAFGPGTLNVINSTIANNSAFFGAAIYGSNITITNSVVWGNTGDSMQIRAEDATVIVKYTDVQGGFTGQGNINAAPLFVNAAAGNFHLLAGSPAIDAGDPAFVPPAGAVDLDGDPRLFGVRIDMGIDEFRKAGDINGDHIVNSIDLLAVINNWGAAPLNSLVDLNHDSVVNTADMLIVIGNWG